MSQCEKNLDAVFVLSSKSWITHCIQSKISKSTPTKATLVKKRLLEESDPQIGLNVIAFDKKQTTEGRLGKL